jgi:hypothetical protein
LWFLFVFFFSDGVSKPRLALNLNPPYLCLLNSHLHLTNLFLIIPKI